TSKATIKRSARYPSRAFYLGPEALGVAAFGLLVDCIVALDSNAAAEQLAGIGHGTRAACYPKTRLLRGGAVAAAERKRLIIRDLGAAGNCRLWHYAPRMMS